MTIAQITDEVTQLSDADRARLLTVLVHLQETKDPDFLQEVTDVLDDDDPSHWVPLSALDKILAE